MVCGTDMKTGRLCRISFPRECLLKQVGQNLRFREMLSEGCEKEFSGVPG